MTDRRPYDDDLITVTLTTGRRTDTFITTRAELDSYTRIGEHMRRLLAEAIDRKIDTTAPLPDVTMPTRLVLALWRPGSRDERDDGDAWTWADEAMWLFTEERGYQLGVIRAAHAAGTVDIDPFAPIILGNDGRVWDGHHRLCAAMALGIPTVTVHVAPQDGGP